MKVGPKKIWPVPAPAPAPLLVLPTPNMVLVW